MDSGSSEGYPSYPSASDKALDFVPSGVILFIDPIQNGTMTAAHAQHTLIHEPSILGSLLLLLPLALLGL